MREWTCHWWIPVSYTHLDVYKRQPLTSGGQPLGCRPEVEFKGKSARILLDQLRSVDKKRLGNRMGKIDLAVWHPVLLEMFA